MIGRDSEGPAMAFPDGMRRTAESRGTAGRAWLATLPDQIDAAARAWSLTMGEVLGGGKSAFVARVKAGDGTPAVLKIAPPGSGFADQVRTIEAAGGRGYVTLLAYDLTRDAALLEALGASLTTAPASAEYTVDTLAAILLDAWSVPTSAVAEVAPGDDKASSLLRLITALWLRLDEPCSRPLRDLAIRYAERRAAAFRPHTAVVCHGDPHAANALRVTAPRAGAATGFVFVDPDGFRCDRGYDLGVVIRGWPEALLAADDPVRLLRGYADRLAAATGVDPQEIWEWGFMERVSSGLFLASSGHEPEGRAFLDSAEALLRRERD